MCVRTDRFTPEGSKWWYGPYNGYYCYGEEILIPNTYSEDYIVCHRHPLLRCEFCGKATKVRKNQAFRELPDGGNSCSQRHAL
jgi:hypothetical protein